MPIPQQHQGRYIYHMTNLENLESILTNGLLSTNEKNRRGIEHVNIANQTIQNRRAAMPVTCEPFGTVHDYVPFYFCPREPMLLGVLNTKNVDQQLIIYLAAKIDVVDLPNVVFTSAAANTNIHPDFYNDSSQLVNLRWDLIDSNKWGFSDVDGQAKMAEVLVYNQVPLTDIDFIVVWNPSIKDEVNNLLEESNLSINVEYDGYQLNFAGKLNYRNHYFTKFWVNERQSLITGPYFLLKSYENTSEKIGEKRQEGVPNPKFHDISDAINQIEQDFSLIPELSEIENLSTANPEHWQGIGDHTKNCVQQLEQLVEYQSLPTPQQKILKLACYLHDIGKGTSPRDNAGKQKADNDHPANALPMLKRVLSEDIEDITDDEIREITMLVVYHDLIGDIVGKGRYRDQIIDVIECIQDFDMLVAISKADIASLIPDEPAARMLSHAPQWLEDINDEALGLRDWVLDELEQEDD